MLEAVDGVGHARRVDLEPLADLADRQRSFRLNDSSISTSYRANVSPMGSQHPLDVGEQHDAPA